MGWSVGDIDAAHHDFRADSLQILCGFLRCAAGAGRVYVKAARKASADGAGETGGRGPFLKRMSDRDRAVHVLSYRHHTA